MSSETARRHPQPLRPLPPRQVKFTDAFWSKYGSLVREVVIPYQYEALHDRVPDAEPSHAIANFEIAAGRRQGEFHGFVFQDTDVAKWLEAVGYSLMTHPDPELERLADEVIDLIAEAQGEDGYLNTYFTIKEPDKRWTNLQDCHELYTAGHLIEAACAYYEATGKRKVLDVACRLADCIDRVFGPNEGQLRGYDGHEEIKLALVKLYRVTGEERYLRLATFFVDERGKEPNFLREEWERRGRINFFLGRPALINLEYHQAHRPVREQTDAVGHAVRAMYLYAAMADLAAENGDESLLEACRRLWHSTTRKRMYVTGGIGSTHHLEAFTTDYDLPNDTVYAESCASIGLIFFAKRMLQIEAKGEYGDVMERALYNTVLAGMAQDGKHYFYVNPLEVWPEACRRNPGKHHVKPVRQRWFGCACCPPNIARLIASLGGYVYDVDPASGIIYTHLYIGGEAELTIGGETGGVDQGIYGRKDDSGSTGDGSGIDNGNGEGCTVVIRQETNYPWDGTVKLIVTPAAGGHPEGGHAEGGHSAGSRPAGSQTSAAFTLALRVPGWSRKAEMTVNGERIKPEVRDGYAYIRRVWQPGDVVELKLDMTIRLLAARPEVRADAGRAAIQRGPLVYCLESADNPGGPLTALAIDTQAPLTASYDPQLLGGCVVIEGSAIREGVRDWQDALYLPLDEDDGKRHEQRAAFRAIPYYLWGNRGEGEMTVWVRYR